METKGYDDSIPGHWISHDLTCGYHPDRPTEKYSNHFWVDSYLRRSEVITPNSGGLRGKRPWKSFEHYLCENEPLPAEQRTRVSHGTYWDKPHYGTVVVTDPLFGYYHELNNFIYAPYGTAGSPDQGLPPFKVPRSDGGFVPPPDDLDALIVRSLRTMLPGIKQELSLLNALFELKDFKRPLRNLLRSVKRPMGFSRRARAVYDYLTKFKRMTLAEASRSVAGSYLEMRFAYMPLISDIQAVLTALSRTERRINDLITRSARKQNKHFVFKWQEYQDAYDLGSEVPPSTPWSSQPNPTIRADRTVRYSPSVFHAQIQYNYNFTEYQLAHAQVLALLDGLGVNKNPAQIIWNALPWSFVIDWVFGVSHWLGQFQVQNMKPKVNICNFCWSIKRHRSISIEKGISTDPVTAGYKDRSMLPTTYQTSYRRAVGIPAASSFETSGLSLDEMSLGAALVIANRRRR